MLKKFGPTGLDLPEYKDITKCFLWEWDTVKFGWMPVDKDRELVFDGTNFMIRVVAEDGTTSRKSISLVKWLNDHIQRRDASILNDTDWKFKNLWHEWLRVTQVITQIYNLNKMHFYVTN